jgi:hypothetical protein
VLTLENRGYVEKGFWMKSWKTKTETAGDPRAIVGALTQLAQNELKDNNVKFVKRDDAGVSRTVDLNDELLANVAGEARSRQV